MQGGVAALLKPPGCSSHDIVGLVRRRLSLPAGHLGTLDPLAAGVLVVAAGSALRLVRYAGEAEKEYRARVLLGVSSPSDDLATEPAQRRSAQVIDRNAVESALQEIAQRTTQLPPSYSARQVGGERAYHAARQGRRLDLPAKPAALHAFEVVEFCAGETAELWLDVRVSAGYYVRSLARDLGECLGVGGLLAGLVRTRAGQFSISESALLEDEWQLFPPDVLVRHLESVEFTADDAHRLTLGQRLPAHGAQDGIYAARLCGRLFAVVRHFEGAYRPDTVIGLEDAED